MFSPTEANPAALPSNYERGGSPVGQRFAAKEADVAFVSVEKHDADTVKSRVDALRRPSTTSKRKVTGKLSRISYEFLACNP